MKELDGSSTWLAYVSAVLLVALATGVRLGLDLLVGPYAVPFVIYYLASAVAMRFLGLGPSILTVLLSAFAVNFLFLAPRFNIGVSANDLLVTGIFLVANFVLLTLSRGMRKTAKTLEGERSTLQSIMNGTLRSHLVYLDRDFNFVKVNEAYARSCGYTPEEMIGKNHFALYPNAENEAIFARVRDTSQPVEFHDKPFEYPDQPERGVTYWDWTLNPVKDTAGKVIGLVFALVETTERKRMEDAVQTSKEELARANAELEQKVQERTIELREMVNELEHFSYTITHDMRAPLRAMQGFGQLLHDECTGCQFTHRLDLIQHIVEASGRMDNLITDALDFSKAMRKEIALEPINAAKLLHEIVGSYPQFQPPKAEIIIEENIPVVMGNGAALTQCFSNLLGNAVKFVPPGKVPTVRIWAERRGEEYVRLWFEDNGIGIAKEYQEQIWIMFQKLEKGYEGTGIGLSLVRKVVERMKGRVGVESEVGKGSRFWVELKRGG
jgi:PAS domain S-box-containing protein